MSLIALFGRIGRSRPTHVGRGLKLVGLLVVPLTAMSPYARRAWVEIVVILAYIILPMCRPTHVGRGLKSNGYFGGIYARRSPYARRAWVEILTGASSGFENTVALRT